VRRARAVVLCASAIAGGLAFSAPHSGATKLTASPPGMVAYQSPYQVSGVDPAFTADLAARIESFTPTGQSVSAPTTSPPAPGWYTASLYGEPSNASWGPAPLVLSRPQPSGSLSTDGIVAYYQQRIAAAASQLIGTAYQHHHLPFWNPYTNGFTPFPMLSTGEPLVPPGQWPWSPVSNNPMSQQFAPMPAGSSWFMTAGTPFSNPYAAQYGTGAAGIDCSDLTSMVYNVAAGLYLNSAVGAQGVANAIGLYSGTSPLGWNNTASPQLVNPRVPTDPDITPMTPTFFIGPNSVYNATTNSRGIGTYNVPGSLDSIVSQLMPGDLLYIANDTSPGNTVTHVVIWLGKYGTVVDAATGTVSQVPLVLSSHDNTPAVLDGYSNLPALGQGSMSPPGVQILPFAQNNWFYSNFSHAMRIITADNVVSSRPDNPLVASRVVPGVVIVGERVADRTPPRLLMHPPARAAAAPIVQWKVGKPISLTAPGLRANTDYNVNVDSGGASAPIGTASSDPDGLARFPVLEFTRSGTYALDIVDPTSGSSRRVIVEASP
jgi:cell wall-associated NlpC family hydrolase